VLGLMVTDHGEGRGGVHLTFLSGNMSNHHQVVLVTGRPDMSGFNPIQQLLGPHVLGSLSAQNQAVLTGRSFFPHLISAPFRAGLREAFAFAIVACLIAAGASLMRGGKYHATDSPADGQARPGANNGAAASVGASKIIIPIPTREEQQHAS